MGTVDVLNTQDFLTDCRDNNFISMKNRRTLKFNFSQTPDSAASDGRRRSPPKGILKKKDTNASSPAAAKNLVLGQVKILKRGEVMSESLSVLKDVNDRRSSNGGASTPEKSSSGYRRRKAVKDKKKTSISVSTSNPNPNPNDNPNPNPDFDDFALSSTDRLGPDPDMVPEIFFAGSAFYDSPPPSSVPLPAFYTKNSGDAVKADPTTDLRRILGLSLT